MWSGIRIRVVRYVSGIRMWLGIRIRVVRYVSEWSDTYQGYVCIARNVHPTPSAGPTYKEGRVSGMFAQPLRSVDKSRGCLSFSTQDDWNKKLFFFPIGDSRLSV